ncbi:MAG: PLP-dependent transferase, partial [Sphingomonadales bacterium]|nr:PLP-dependent transferase [Sphingomonadales bacterium]
HSDLVAGSAAGSEEWIAPVRGLRGAIGTMIDPYTSWMIMRSLETLKIRVEAANRNARIIAEYLNEHPKITKVQYLEFLDADNPSREIYERQCTGAGSTFAFDVDGGEAEAFRFLDQLQVMKLAVSLGGTETLISHPASGTHSGVAKDVRDAAGVTDALIRISVGIEDADDLIADLAQALEAI